MSQIRTYKPKAPIKIHWQGLLVYQKGEQLEGDKKVEALQKWKKALDPTIYCFPRSYGPQNIDWEGLPK